MSDGSVDQAGVHAANRTVGFALLTWRVPARKSGVMQSAVT
jgi:hypothetical protein